MFLLMHFLGMYKFKPRLFGGIVILLVVGADGANSRIRQALNYERPRKLISTYQVDSSFHLEDPDGSQLNGRKIVERTPTMSSW